MKPLSAFKFFVENKKRAIIFLIVLTLSVAVVAFITSLSDSIILDALDANLKPFTQSSIVTRSSDEMFLKDEIVTRINSFEETQEAINVIMQNTSYSSLIGNTSSPIYFLETHEDISNLISLNNLRLKDGRLPELDDYELVLNKKILKNKGLGIGDYIGDDVQPEEWLTGKYKVVGVLEGEALIGFGTKCYYKQAYQEAGLTMDKPLGLVIIPKAGQLNNLNKKLDNIDRKDASTYTYSSLKVVIDDEIKSMNMLVRIIVIAVVMILSISVGALVYIIYMNRVEEFGILYAMGYSKGFINKLILKELAGLTALCWVFGYILSMLMVYGINYIILYPIGQTLYFFTVQIFINTLFIPVMVLACAAYPILHKLKKWDPIAIIERRE